jgi:septum formation protein
MDNVVRYFIYGYVFSLSLNIMQKIVLASQSPRRSQLLDWAEIPYEVIVKETDEKYPPTLPVEQIPVHIAANKAKAISDQIPADRIVLAADTIVVLGENILGKPVHKEDAISMLIALSGTKHRVITGVVIKKGQQEISFSDITEVEFHSLSIEQIENYVEKYKPYDKAGAYAIQEWVGVVGIKSINGDFYNVMGLPVSRVVQALKTMY